MTEQSPHESNSDSSEKEYEDSDYKDRIAETCPQGRFIRFNEELGFGAYKIVYRAYDNDSGCEVAWNVIKLQRLPPNETQRISEEISLLKNLHHPNIINFITAWVNSKKKEVVFITECVSGGSLKRHLKKIRKPRLKIIKNWCRQILKGLVYLHQQKPYPIIHRDIKCENVFINTTRNEIRIGDLGLAVTLKNSSHTTSVIGTPEFMAPEIYEEKYGTPVDIYSFGMCVLEMATLTTPYQECTSAAQVYKKVSSGILPSSIYQIQSEGLKSIILQCLSASTQRPSAQQLLDHKFFDPAETEEDKYPVQLSNADVNSTQNEEESQRLQGSSMSQSKSASLHPKNTTNTKSEKEIVIDKPNPQVNNSSRGGSSASSTLSHKKRRGQLTIDILEDDQQQQQQQQQQLSQGQLSQAAKQSQQLGSQTQQQDQVFPEKVSQFYQKDQIGKQAKNQEQQLPQQQQRQEQQKQQAQPQQNPFQETQIAYPSSQKEKQQFIAKPIQEKKLPKTHSEQNLPQANLNSFQDEIQGFPAEHQDIPHSNMQTSKISPRSSQKRYSLPNTNYYKGPTLKLEKSEESKIQTNPVELKETQPVPAHPVDSIRLPEQADLKEPQPQQCPELSLLSQNSQIKEETVQNSSKNFQQNNINNNQILNESSQSNQTNPYNLEDSKISNIESSKDVSSQQDDQFQFQQISTGLTPKDEQQKLIVFENQKMHDSQDVFQKDLQLQKLCYSLYLSEFAQEQLFRYAFALEIKDKIYPFDITLDQMTVNLNEYSRNTITSQISDSLQTLECQGIKKVRQDIVEDAVNRFYEFQQKKRKAALKRAADNNGQIAPMSNGKIISISPMKNAIQIIDGDLSDERSDSVATIAAQSAGGVARVAQVAPTALFSQPSLDGNEEIIKESMHLQEEQDQEDEKKENQDHQLSQSNNNGNNNNRTNNNNTNHYNAEEVVSEHENTEEVENNKNNEEEEDDDDENDDDEECLLSDSQIIQQAPQGLVQQQLQDPVEVQQRQQQQQQQQQQQLFECQQQQQQQHTEQSDSQSGWGQFQHQNWIQQQQQQSNLQLQQLQYQQQQLSQQNSQSHQSQQSSQTQPYTPVGHSVKSVWNASSKIYHHQRAGSSVSQGRALMISGVGSTSQGQSAASPFLERFNTTSNSPDSHFYLSKLMDNFIAYYKQYWEQNFESMLNENPRLMKFRQEKELIELQRIHVTQHDYWLQHQMSQNSQLNGQQLFGNEFLVSSGNNNTHQSNNSYNNNSNNIRQPNNQLTSSNSRVLHHAHSGLQPNMIASPYAAEQLSQQHHQQQLQSHQVPLLNADQQGYIGYEVEGMSESQQHSELDISNISNVKEADNNYDNTHITTTQLNSNNNNNNNSMEIMDLSSMLAADASNHHQHQLKSTTLQNNSAHHSNHINSSNTLQRSAAVGQGSNYPDYVVSPHNNNGGFDAPSSFSGFQQFNQFSTKGLCQVQSNQVGVLQNNNNGGNSSSNSNNQQSNQLTHASPKTCLQQQEINQFAGQQYFSPYQQSNNNTNTINVAAVNNPQAAAPTQRPSTPNQTLSGQAFQSNEKLRNYANAGLLYSSNQKHTAAAKLNGNKSSVEKQQQAASIQPQQQSNTSQQQQQQHPQASIPSANTLIQPKMASKPPTPKQVAFTGNPPSNNSNGTPSHAHQQLPLKPLKQHPASVRQGNIFSYQSESTTHFNFQFPTNIGEQQQQQQQQSNAVHLHLQQQQQPNSSIPQANTGALNNQQQQQQQPQQQQVNPVVAAAVAGAAVKIKRGSQRAQQQQCMTDSSQLYQLQAGNKQGTATATATAATVQQQQQQHSQSYNSPVMLSSSLLIHQTQQPVTSQQQPSSSISNSVNMFKSVDRSDFCQLQKPLAKLTKKASSNKNSSNVIHSHNDLLDAAAAHTTISTASTFTAATQQTPQQTVAPAVASDRYESQHMQQQHQQQSRQNNHFQLNTNTTTTQKEDHAAHEIMQHIQQQQQQQPLSHLHQSKVNLQQEEYHSQQFSAHNAPKLQSPTYRQIHQLQFNHNQANHSDQQTNHVLSNSNSQASAISSANSQANQQQQVSHNNNNNSANQQQQFQLSSAQQSHNLLSPHSAKITQFQQQQQQQQQQLPIASSNINNSNSQNQQQHHPAPAAPPTQHLTPSNNSHTSQTHINPNASSSNNCPPDSNINNTNTSISSTASSTSQQQQQQTTPKGIHQRGHHHHTALLSRPALHQYNTATASNQSNPAVNRSENPRQGLQAPYSVNLQLQQSQQQHGFPDSPPVLTLPMKAKMNQQAVAAATTTNTHQTVGLQDPLIPSSEVPLQYHYHSLDHEHNGVNYDNCNNCERSKQNNTSSKASVNPPQ